MQARKLERNKTVSHQLKLSVVLIWSQMRNIAETKHNVIHTFFFSLKKEKLIKLPTGKRQIDEYFYKSYFFDYIYLAHCLIGAQTLKQI